MYYLNDKLNAIAQAIVDLMPPVEDFFASEDTIEAFSQHHARPENLDPVFLERQSVYVDLMQQKVERLFGDTVDIRWDAIRTGGLAAGVVVHHGILNHPVLAGVDVVTHYHHLLGRKEGGDIITFATGNIPHGNLFFRRGIMIEGNRVNLYPKKLKNQRVYGLPVKEFHIIERLKATGQWSKHSSSVQETLQFVEQVINDIDLSTCNTLGDQYTKINNALWPYLFEEGVRGDLANLVTLEYDDIVSAYLVHTYENDPSSFIAQVLFDDAARERALIFFEGKTGAWDDKRNTGSHFFWGLSEGNEHVQLHLKDGALVTAEGERFVEWNPDAIKEALNAKRILPCMLLKFMLILFYMGMKPYAGFASGNYLTSMRGDIAAFLSDDPEQQYVDDIDRMQTVVTNTVTSVPVLLQQRADGKITDYFAFDIIKNGGLRADYLQAINTVPLKYFMAPNLNTMYDYAFNLFGEGEQPALHVGPEDYSELFQSVF